MMILFKLFRINYAVFVTIKLENVSPRPILRVLAYGGRNNMQFHLFSGIQRGIQVRSSVMDRKIAFFGP